MKNTLQHKKKYIQYIIHNLIKAVTLLRDNLWLYTELLKTCKCHKTFSVTRKAKKFTYVFVALVFYIYASTVVSNRHAVVGQL